VVLVSPRNPLNIGAAARAMANFGFPSLAVVAPFAPRWREARSAVGAPDVLGAAQQAETLGEAVGKCTLVVGTGTRTHRRPEQPGLRLDALAALLSAELERGGRAALVFGPEKHGLTRDALSRCHFLVEIPTDPRQPSMNLGQAVAVCLYELSRTEEKVDARESPPAAIGATARADSATVDRLGALIEQTMTASGYSPAMMHAANRHDLELLLRRIALDPGDAQRALGLFRRILWRIKHPRAEPPVDKPQ